MIVDAVIPARDVVGSIGRVVRAVPPRVVRSVVVVDGGSRDGTARAAEDAGALVLRAAPEGAGTGCLRALGHLGSLPRPPDAVVFLAGDGGDDPADIPAVLAPLAESLFDLVIGSRRLSGDRGRRRVGNLVAVSLIRAIYGYRYSDVGTFRAIRYPALVALGLREPGSGLLVEMQVKALKTGLRIAEVPVHAGPEAPGRGMGLGDTGKALYQILRHAALR